MDCVRHLFPLAATVLACVALTACGPDSLATGGAEDMGTQTLPNGTVVHGYTLKGETFHDHIYFVEDDGKIIGGLSAMEAEGKAHRAVQTVVTPTPAPAGAPTGCTTLVECHTKIDDLELAAAIAELKENRFRNATTKPR